MKSSVEDSHSSKRPLSSRLVFINEKFATFFAYLASVNIEFGMRPHLVYDFLDHTTLAWSSLIVFTSLLKFFLGSNMERLPSGVQQEPISSLKQVNVSNYKELLRLYFKRLHPQVLKAEPSSWQHEEPTLTDCLLLSYLPKLGDFSSLYHSLICIALSPVLVWRLYLSWYRPLAQRRAKSKSGRRARREELKWCAKRKLVHFFIYGPGKEQGGSFDGKATLKRDQVRRLARQLHFVAHHQVAPLRINEERLNEVRVHEYFDYEENHDQRRWLYLVKYVYAFWLLLLLIGSPITYFTYDGLSQFMQNFSFNKRGSLAGRLLFVYGAFEQSYALVQASAIFVYTNLFITLFHADVQYKFERLKADLVKLRRRYLSGESDEPMRESCSYQQCRLVAFFRYIGELDTYVSRYSYLAQAIFFIIMLFGHSYFWLIENDSLKYGSLVTLLGAFISFTYLFCAAWDIERKVSILPAACAVRLKSTYPLIISFGLKEQPVLLSHHVHC